jgi:dCTP deaminase
MIKNDKWIIEQAKQGMITPFQEHLVRKLVLGEVEIPAISFGLSSYGYDIRLSPAEFLVFRHIPGTIVDPKNFNPKNLEAVELHHDQNGDYFILPGNSYGLGVSLETISMPSNVTAICLGKSTYARVGIIANITPLEASWKGAITLEFSNSSHADVKVYANEGICQLLFFEGDPCQTTYADRQGKYQNQGQKVTLAKV